MPPDTKDGRQDGNVLLVSYVGRDHTEEHKFRVEAQEFDNIESLQKSYDSPKSHDQTALRVIHVQDAPWAVKLLLKKFNIDHCNDPVGTQFARWARYEKPQQRAGKPILKGKTFSTQRDPSRNISRTSFGLDYLKHYPADSVPDSAAADKMMELNHYDATGAPAHGYDVFVQRLAVFIQHKEALNVTFMAPDAGSPCYLNEAEDKGLEHLNKQHDSGSAGKGGKLASVAEPVQPMPDVKSFDNGSVVIIFEHSQSRAVEDTLIGARQETESRWQRLTLSLPQGDAVNDENLALQCMDLVLCDIFKALASAWEQYLSSCGTHVSILEDKVYDSPADESRAPELWASHSLWRTVENLMRIHVDTVKEMRMHLRELAGEEIKEQWLGTMQDEFEKLANLVEEKLIRPTDNLRELMYQSVQIRDSRHNLELGTSMWRLSWITFIFLPLTFLVGFFGIDPFRRDPSVKWFVIFILPLTAIVVALWFSFKYSSAARIGYPTRRGVYEHEFHALSNAYPQLWSRAGPRTDVEPQGFSNKMKWRLILSWYAPSKTTLVPSYEPREEIGAWSRVKRYLVWHWLGQIKFATASSIANLELGEDSILGSDLNTNHVLNPFVTPLMATEAQPAIARSTTPPSRYLRPASASSGPSRPSSATSSRFKIEKARSDVSNDEILNK